MVSPNHLVAVEPPCMHSRTWNVRYLTGRQSAATSAKEVSAVWRSPLLSTATYDIYDHTASPCANTIAQQQTLTSPARSSTYHRSNLSPLRATSGKNYTSSASTAPRSYCSILLVSKRHTFFTTASGELPTCSWTTTRSIMQLGHRYYI